MSLRLLIPLTALLAVGGFLGGRLAHARWGDRAEQKPAPSGAARAIEAYERIRAADDDPAQRDALRRAFVADWPASWLARHWERAR